MVSKLVFSTLLFFSAFTFAQHAATANTVLMGGKPVHTYAKLPPVNQPAPRFILTDVAMKEQTLDSYQGKFLILNIFPSCRYRGLFGFRTSFQ